MDEGGRELRQQTLHAAPQGGGGYFLSGDIIQPLVGGAQTDGHSSLSRITVLPGNGQMLHRHAQHETLYILDGELSFRGTRGSTIRGFTGGPGTLLHFPGCVPHSYFNATSQPATLLSFSTPSGMEGFYAQAGQRVEAAADAAGLSTDPGHIETIGWEFGIEPIDPALYDAREGYRASGTHYMPPAQGKCYVLLNSLVRILADANQTEGWLTVLEIFQRPGGEAPMHKHSAACTSFVLDGSFSFTGQTDEGRKNVAAGSGNALHRSRGMNYAFQNNATINSRMLSFITPAGIEDFVRAVGREIDSPAEFFSGEWQAQPADELQRIAALASQLGVDIHLDG